MNLDVLRRKWLAERPIYEKLCIQVERILRPATRQRGIPCRIEARAKAVDSLLKKALRKDYPDPYQDIRDKAGVRVVCPYLDFLPPLEEVVRHQFVACEHDNKALRLRYDQLGYSGIHFEVKLPAGLEEYFPELVGKVCEVQLLTESQSLWANVSHDLVYKPSQSPPEPVKRKIYHQAALLQSFDEQVSQARAELLSLPEFQEARMLEELEKHFYQFTASRFDRELSLYILGALKSILSEAEIEGFGGVVDEFVESKQAHLACIFEQGSEMDWKSPLLSQPETIMIFMCFDRKLFALKEAWGKILPLEELQHLAEEWPADIGTIT